MAVPCPRPVLHATPICSVIWPQLLPWLEGVQETQEAPATRNKEQDPDLHSPRKDDVWQNSDVTAPTKVHQRHREGNQQEVHGCGSQKPVPVPML